MGDVNATRSGSTGIAGDLLAWFAFLIAAVALAARFAPVDNHAVLGIAALSPYLAIGGAALSAAVLLRGRRRLLGALACVLLAVSIGVQAPRFVGSGRPADHRVPVRVLTANLQEGEADPVAVSEVARSDADLLIVQELTPEFAAGLQLGSDFPHRVADAQPGAAGVGIWSRYPLVESTRISGYELGMLRATVRVPGAATSPIVLAAHLVGPWPQPIGPWRQEVAALPNTLRRVAASAGDAAVIVAGDLNATADMRPFRTLLDAGYRDAAAQSGAGLNRTYPSDTVLPPLIGIDHILTRNSSASDVRTVPIPGSDHLGVSATVHLPG